MLALQEVESIPAPVDEPAVEVDVSFLKQNILKKYHKQPILTSCDYPCDPPSPFTFNLTDIAGHSPQRKRHRHDRPAPNAWEARMWLLARMRMQAHRCGHQVPPALLVSWSYLIHRHRRVLSYWPSNLGDLHWPASEVSLNCPILVVSMKLFRQETITSLSSVDPRIISPEFVPFPEGDVSSTSYSSTPSLPTCSRDRRIRTRCIPVLAK